MFGDGMRSWSSVWSSPLSFLLYLLSIKFSHCSCRLLLGETFCLCHGNQVVEEAKHQVENKPRLLRQVAQAALDHPNKTIRKGIYPVMSREKCQAIVKAAILELLLAGLIGALLGGQRCGWS